MDQVEIIDRIEAKVDKLATQTKALKSENARLIEENNKLKAELNQDRATLGQLKDKLEGTQRALEKQRQGEPEEVTALRSRIEESLKEVEACIEWLQKA